MSSNSRRRLLPKLIFNKFDTIPFEILCSFLVCEEMFSLLMSSKVIRLKVYKVGSSHATIKSFPVGERLTATFPKIKLYARFNCKMFNEAEFLTLDRLVELDLDYYGRMHSKIANTSMKHLRNLTKLSFYGDQISGDAIVQLTKIKNLSLRYNNDSVTDAHMIKLTTLTSLSLHECSISDASIIHLTCLRMLSLQFTYRKITPAALEKLTNLTSLELMNDDHVFSGHEMTNLTTLRELIITNIVTVRNDFLSQMTFLEKFSLKSSTGYITDDLFKNLHQLSHLCIISNYKLTGESFKYLVNLKHLVLRNSEVNGRYLRDLTQLSHLEIGFNRNVSWTDVMWLTSVKNLVLNLNDKRKISDRMIGKFQNVEVIKIVGESPFSYGITVEAFRPLKKLKRVIATKYYMATWLEFFEQQGIEFISHKE
ncbi:MAG: hypothetical protein Harvfovirus22_15 [Harvfovirus sp.]|uniref:Disease resistance R13L4/SHOC-2-like LRR domain-containing protein n=1 Tax=Harvfovirus sp. TaxID=2487768 RepID=A0A3G5A286_9VIRU|nr:MAG: hypothetical protein Harvfovirus22_15 [Harvfovirus sp.]